MKYEIVECSSGKQNLEAALDVISKAGTGRVIGVVPDNGGNVLAVVGRGMVFGFLIIVEYPE